MVAKEIRESGEVPFSLAAGSVDAQVQSGQQSYVRPASRSDDLSCLGINAVRRVGFRRLQYVKFVRAVSKRHFHVLRCEGSTTTEMQSIKKNGNPPYFVLGIMYYLLCTIYLHYCCTYMLIRIAYTASWDGSNMHFRDGIVVVFPRAGTGRYHFRWRVGDGSVVCVSRGRDAPVGFFSRAGDGPVAPASGIFFSGRAGIATPSWQSRVQPARRPETLRVKAWLYVIFLCQQNEIHGNPRA